MISIILKCIIWHRTKYYLTLLSKGSKNASDRIRVCFPWQWEGVKGWGGRREPGRLGHLHFSSDSTPDPGVLCVRTQYRYVVYDSVLSCKEPDLGLANFSRSSLRAIISCHIKSLKGAGEAGCAFRTLLEEGSKLPTEEAIASAPNRKPVGG